MDYDELGFRCGIEIHQQLDTEKKLFCNCPTDNVNKEADARIKRSLRPVPGERGSVDEAAKFEFLKDNSFLYNFYKEVCCLVELDEEPPHKINEEAMNTALQFALMINCKIPDKIHFMRKLVLDGSNTSGFQRTALIALDGYIETDQGKVNIPDVELEEESAGKHGKSDGREIFDLDRLGIPLIEIGTDTSIKNPEHAKEAAMKIGMLLRSTGNVKRGLGTIRQDVNVSIEEGARVEIKGFQDVRNLDKLVEKEVRRQKTLLEIKKKLEERSEAFEREVYDVTELFKDSDNDIIDSVLDDGGKVYATRLPLEGFMNKELCEGKTLGKELSGYAVAQGLNGIMHTDEDVSKYGLSKQFKELSEHLDKEKEEVVCIAAGPDDKTNKALKAVVERASKLFEGVPEETRSANDDFTTDYSRPLPGSARMYPETDVRPFTADKNYIKSLKDNIPKTLDEREEELSKEIGEQLASQIISSKRLEDFEEICEIKKFDKKFVANLFVNILKDLESRYKLETEDLSVNNIKKTLKLYFDGDIPKDSVAEVLRFKAEDPDRNIEEIVEEEDLGKTSDEDIRKVVTKVLEEKMSLLESKGEHARGALMGLVMERIGSGAEGSKVNKILSEELKKFLED